MKLENSDVDVLDLTHSPSPSFKTPIKQEDNSANFLDLTLSPSPVTNTPIKLKNNVDILDLTHLPLPLPLPSPLNRSTDILDLTHTLSPIRPMPLHSSDHKTDDDSAVIQFPGTLPCDCSSLSLDLLQHTIKKWVCLPHGREKEWAVQYDRELFTAFNTCLQLALNGYYSDVAHHIEDGKAILQSIEDVISTPCPRCRAGLKYDIVLLYDVLVVLIPKLTFYEVMLSRKNN